MTESDMPVPNESMTGALLGHLDPDDRRSRHAIDIDHYLPALLTHLAIKFAGGAAMIYRRQFGVTITDWRIMALLANEPWMSAGHITEVFGYDKAAVSRSVRSLHERRLIETRFHGGNRRRRHLALTADGLRMHDEIARIALARENQLAAGLSKDERDTVIRLLTRMSAEIPKLSGE